MEKAEKVEKAEAMGQEMTHMHVLVSPEQMELARRVAATVGATFAGLRRREWNHCARCGRPFVGLRIRRYCSQSCRQLAYIHRLRARTRANAHAQTTSASHRP